MTFFNCKFLHYLKDKKENLLVKYKRKKNDLLTITVTLNVMIISGDTLRKTKVNFQPMNNEYTKQPTIRARRAVQSAI